MKPFKTHRQQLNILRGRGLEIKDGSKSMRILERENYYSLINGYKDLFLLKDNDNKVIEPEKYINGASFDEIYSLYCFDRELRSILLKEILKFECNIKTRIAYSFSDKYRQENAYLNMTNYSRDPSQFKEILKLTRIIHDNIKNNISLENIVENLFENFKSKFKEITTKKGHSYPVANKSAYIKLSRFTTSRFTT